MKHYYIAVMWHKKVEKTCYLGRGELNSVRGTVDSIDQAERFSSKEAALDSALEHLERFGHAKALQDIRKCSHIRRDEILMAAARFLEEGNDSWYVGTPDEAYKQAAEAIRGLVS